MINENYNIRYFLKLFFFNIITGISFLTVMSIFCYYLNGYKDITYIFFIFWFTLMVGAILLADKLKFNNFYKNNLIVSSFIFIISIVTIIMIYNTPYYGKDEYYKNNSIYHVEIEKQIISKNYDQAINYMKKLERFDDPAFVNYKKEIKILKERNKVTDHSI